MKKFLMKLWKEEEGAETAEWIVIVALIVGVALVVYNQILLGVLTTAVTNIGAIINAPPPP